MQCNVQLVLLFLEALSEGTIVFRLGLGCGVGGQSSGVPLIHAAVMQQAEIRLGNVLTRMYACYDAYMCLLRHLRRT
jgi:hypothetical protein